MKRRGKTIATKFINLDDHKRRKILNAAFREFAEKGFEQASTNVIVKEAGIGKGMLFYYFKNKQGLYEYLIEYTLDVIMEDYLQRIEPGERDFIERFKHAARVKMKAFLEHPDLFRFSGTFMLDQESIPDRLKPRMEQLQKRGNEIMYENINYSLFRDDVDVEKAFRLIRWAIEGYQNEMKQRLYGANFATFDFDPYWKEFDEYLDVLRKSFYS
ncbi:TetR/AcrR family transcriptional regulator [Thalassobacillus sp. B23F22_16]|uniref:TetR/AcrR family transcriptional regulator n=1 Tax=Thalassobacillus sp. B23F22_16 TaxID=3459513 RepID=UPI00373F5944